MWLRWKRKKEIGFIYVQGWLVFCTALFSEESGTFPGLWENNNISDVQNSLELGLSQWKVQVLAAGKVGAVGFQSMILKVFILFLV